MGKLILAPRSKALDFQLTRFRFPFLKQVTIGFLGVYKDYFKALSGDLKARNPNPKPNPTSQLSPSPKAYASRPESRMLSAKSYILNPVSKKYAKFRLVV